MAKTRRMTEGAISRHLLAHALPLILGNFFQLTYNAVDSIVIGKFAGESALAAVSAANPVMTIVILGVSGISIGASVLMSRFFGAGEEEMLRREVATTMIFGAGASLAVFALGMPASGVLLRLLRVPEEILPMATAYLRIIFVGFLFTFQYNILAASVLFVAGLKWGVVGAGIATVIAQGASMLLCFLHMQRRVPVLRLGMKDMRIDRALLKATLESGSVTALQQACQPVGKVLIQSVINAQGVAMIAAFNAVSRVDDFACIPEQSISSAMMTCIAQNRGAGKPMRVKETLKCGMMLEAAYGIFILLAVQLVKRPVMQLFAAQDSVQMAIMGVDYLSLMAFFYILPGMTNGIQGFFRGMGEMKTTLVATFIQISIRTAVVYLLVPRIGISGAAYACAIGWSLMLIYAFFRYRRVAQSLD